MICKQAGCAGLGPAQNAHKPEQVSNPLDGGVDGHQRLLPIPAVAAVAAPPVAAALAAGLVPRVERAVARAPRAAALAALGPRQRAHVDALRRAELPPAAAAATAAAAWLLPPRRIEAQHLRARPA